VLDDYRRNVEKHKQKNRRSYEMVWKALNLLVILLCVGWGFTMTAGAQDNSEINAALNKARQLAGDDKYLLITERLQCREVGPDGKLLNQPTATNANVEPTRVFDNVYYVGGESNGGWLITTSDGYILLDAMYGNSPEKTIIPGMKKFGLDPSKIKYILITHAGPDHAGGAGYFQSKYGTRVIMDKASWDGLLTPPPDSWQPRLEQLRKTGQFDKIPEPEKDWIGPPKRDMEGADGQKLTLGDTTITMVFTPRTANGAGLSYIIPVKDGGKPHTWVTWGNTGLPPELKDKLVYRESLGHFRKYTEAAKADVVMSSHPFVDGSLERMKELRNRKPGEANPFVVGQEVVRRFLDILDQCAALEIARYNAGQDGFGRPLKK
jgi:metallo-beta-lactamase class B